MSCMKTNLDRKRALCTRAEKVLRKSISAQVQAKLAAASEPRDAKAA